MGKREVYKYAGIDPDRKPKIKFRALHVEKVRWSDVERSLIKKFGGVRAKPTFKP